MMDLDQLQSVRDRERQTDKLQQLRDSFYADAAELIADLREERDRAASEAADPFDDPRVGRLTDQIDTAEQTVEAIYEKRVGKLVKAASFAAADLPAETEGMTTEEQDLFDDLVADIQANRQRVLEVLAGEGRPASDTPQTAPGRESEGGVATADGPVSADAADPADVDAASLMGGDDSPPPPSPPTPETDHDEDADVDVDSDGDGVDNADEVAATAEGAARPAPDDGSTGDASGPPQPREGEARSGSAGAADPSPAGSEASEDNDADVDGPGSDGEEELPDRNGDRDGGRKTATADEIDRTTVRITADVGEIFGVDERAYHLEADQIVTLPAANAEPLLEQDAAERVD
jgi:DNA replication factor GINS